MSPEITPLELKRFIIDTLALEDLQPEDIGDDEPLFAHGPNANHQGRGLGLDSIDGLELDIALRKRFRLDGPTGKPTNGAPFSTIRSLVAFLAAAAHPPVISECQP